MTTSTSPADDAVTPGQRSSARSGVWLAEVALLLMALIWGINFSVIKYGTSILPPLGYNAVRTMLAAVSLMCIALIWGGAPPKRRDFLMLLGLGALGNGIYQTLFIEGLSRTRAGEAALVVGASPALMAIFARMRGIESVDTRRGIGIALSIFGVGLVVAGRATVGEATSGGSLFGDLLVLVGSVCWAVYTVLVLPFTQRVSGFWVLALNLVGGAAVLLTLGARGIIGVDWLALPAPAWAAILYSGLGGLVIAYMFWLYGVRKVGPTRTALYGNVQPLIALVFAWLTLGEVPTLWQIIGAATIVGGVLLTRVPASEAT